MSFTEYLSPLIGRWMLVWFFLSEVGTYGGDWYGTVARMSAGSIPAAPLVLAILLMALILGSLSLALGYFTRQGALLLFAVTIFAAVSMQGLWPAGRGGLAQPAADFQIFAHNIAVAGGLLLLVGMGPGAFALDNRHTRRSR